MFYPMLLLSRRFILSEPLDTGKFLHVITRSLFVAHKQCVSGAFQIIMLEIMQQRNSTAFESRPDSNKPAQL